MRAVGRDVHELIHDDEHVDELLHDHVQDHYDDDQSRPHLDDYEHEYEHVDALQHHDEHGHDDDDEPEHGHGDERDQPDERDVDADPLAECCVERELLMRAVIRHLARGDGGMTLIELLVSLVIGVVVALGVFSLIEVTTRAAGRITDQVGANQIGRDTLAYIETELEDSCIQPGGAQTGESTVADWGPIQYGLTSPSSSSTTLKSDGSDLVFWTVSDATQTTSTEAAAGTSYALHDLSFAGGMITDTTWPVTGGTSPTSTTSPFTYGTATTTVLGEIGTKGIISQVVSSGTTLPIFEYYDYNSSYQLSSPLTPLASPLSASIAPNVVEVGINFQVEGTPSDNTASENNQQAAPYDVSDVVDLRLTAVENPSSTNVPYACQ